ncbi:zinc-dependent peptidase [Carboxylicivirga sp. M1479]|uniref:zinc-dependent peptidase n=1 Tax=Carboxylicivirga sp. M1479 TaxID=2594476 RepID=UPI001177684D|nr:zinc-dependent peptidase [Carboxylicivirga sp. M1479]TRX70460.1 zinc-dependent peptidase [Carboxylicivirga sp. M1479]
MSKEHIYIIGIFLFGMLIALIAIARAYIQFIQSKHLKLSIAKHLPEWKKMNSILSEEFNYYKNLPENLKTEFSLRTIQFMRTCKWLSPVQSEITLRQKTLVSASAIQLTFGLQNFGFGRFKTILLYDDAYYNKSTKQYHRGEVNHAGLIVLSWKYFEQGYAIDNDKINLGLHEMAHALDLVVQLSQGRHYNMQRIREKFQHSALEEMLAMRQNSNRFFRSYGASNQHEFFSVAVEHFFEASCEFSQKLPELYLEMCQLLNQDPCNKLYKSYKNPHNNQYNNNFTTRQLDFSKPQIVLNPNNHIAIPFILFSVIYFTTLPILKILFHSWSIVHLSIWIFIYLIYLALIYNKKAKAICITTKHLLSWNFLLRNRRFTVHLNNIVNIEFTYMLTYYKTNISYFEQESIKQKQLSLYISPTSIKKLERLLLQQGLKIKHNNKWLKKESL